MTASAVAARNWPLSSNISPRLFELAFSGTLSSSGVADNNPQSVAEFAEAITREFIALAAFTQISPVFPGE